MSSDDSADVRGATHSRAVVDGWLRERLADSLQIDPHRMRTTTPLATYGLDSMLSAMLLTEIEDHFGVLVDPTELPPGLSLDDLTRIVHASTAGLPAPA